MKPTPAGISRKSIEQANSDTDVFAVDLSCYASLSYASEETPFPKRLVIY